MRLAGMAFAALLIALPSAAGPDAFVDGPRVPSFGKSAPVTAEALPAGATFKIAFDVSTPSEGDALSRQLDSPARLLNMLALAGVADENVAVAIVVHGKAAMDLVTDARRGSVNPNAPLIAELVAAGADIQLCGQTAVHYDIAPEDLLPGVRLSLSAMTSHAQLQHEGYTLNPF